MDYNTTMSDEQEAIAEQQEQEGAEGQRIKALIESLLFVADEPARVDHLAQSLGVSARKVKEALEELATEYRHRGLRLQFKDGRVQMVTAPEAAPVIERFLGLQLTSKLSPAALETLAIIAYRHPITRPQIDAIRGVNSDSVVRGLLAKGLIEEVGRLDQAGRPILYAPTFAFLQHFGLESLDQLPPLEDDAE